MGEWIYKIEYIWTMAYYLVPKSNEQSSHEKTWRDLKRTLLSERSQSETATYCMNPTIKHFGEDKTIETIKRSVLPALVGKNGQTGHREFLKL